MMKGIQMMGPGVEQFTVIYDREGVTRKNFDLPLVKEWATIQNYFPLRLGLALVLQPNWLFQMSYKICSVFLSEESNRKIQLTTKNWKSELQAFISRDQLLICHGGTMETAYEFTLAVRLGMSPLSAAQRERQIKLEEAKAEGDLELQAQLIQEQYEAWENDLQGDNSVAGNTLRKRLSSFSSKKSPTDSSTSVSSRRHDGTTSSASVKKTHSGTNSGSGSKKSSHGEGSKGSKRAQDK